MKSHLKQQMHWQPQFCLSFPPLHLSHSTWYIFRYYCFYIAVSQVSQSVMAVKQHAQHTLTCQNRKSTGAFNDIHGGRIISYSFSKFMTLVYCIDGSALQVALRKVYCPFLSAACWIVASILQKYIKLLVWILTICPGLRSLSIG